MLESFRRHIVWYDELVRINQRRSLPCALFSRLSLFASELVTDLNAILIGRKRSLPRVKLCTETHQPPGSAIWSVYCRMRTRPRCLYDSEIYSATFYRAFRIIRQSHNCILPFCCVTLLSLFSHFLFFLCFKKQNPYSTRYCYIH